MFQCENISVSDRSVQKRKDFFFGRPFLQGIFIGLLDAFMWPAVKVSLHGVASKQFSFCMFPVCRGSWSLSEKLL